VFAFGGLTACAGDDSRKASNAGRDARELAEHTSQLMRKVGDFRVTGFVDSEGVRATVDGCVRDGSDFEVRFDFDGHLLEILLVGETTYTKGDIRALGALGSDDEEETAAMGEVDARLDGKYLKTPAEDSEEDSFLGMFDPFSDGIDGIVKGDPVRIDGVWLIPLSMTDEDDEEEVATVYVRESGPPYPVMVKTEGTEVGTIKYTKGKKPCTPVAPPADQTMDAAELFGEEMGDEPVL